MSLDAAGIDRSETLAAGSAASRSESRAEDAKLLSEIDRLTKPLHPARECGVGAASSALLSLIQLEDRLRDERSRLSSRGGCCFIGIATGSRRKCPIDGQRTDDWRSLELDWASRQRLDFPFAIRSMMGPLQCMSRVILRHGEIGLLVPPSIFATERESSSYSASAVSPKHA